MDNWVSKLDNITDGWVNIWIWGLHYHPSDPFLFLGFFQRSLFLVWKFYFLTILVNLWNNRLSCVWLHEKHTGTGRGVTNRWLIYCIITQRRAAHNKTLIKQNTLIEQSVATQTNLIEHHSLTWEPSLKTPGNTPGIAINTISLPHIADLHTNSIITSWRICGNCKLHFKQFEYWHEVPPWY